LHMDVKRLARFQRPGHWAMGRAEQHRTRHAGWVYLHVVIDDHSRYLYVEQHDHEDAETNAATLQQPAAWQLLEQSEEWEVAERYVGGHVRLGRPRLRRAAGGGAAGVAIKGPAAQEGLHGHRVELPNRFAGASWVETEIEARAEFERRLSDCAAQTPARSGYSG